jgi:flagella basal body P-ring formation protein FlgA
MHRRSAHTILLTAATLAAASSSQAADIHLKSRATAQGPSVRLTDVAEIHGAPDEEAKQLGQIELFAAPPQEQYLTARQVREALLARGVDPRKHTISGASVIEMGPAARAAVPSIFARPAIGTSHRRDEQNHPAAEAIVRFLKAQVDAGLPWQVDLLSAERSGDDSGVELVALPGAGARDVAVVQAEHAPRRGGIRAWLGRQQFVLRWTVAGRRRQEIVAAEVSLPGTVVVAARDLPRGAILQAADLKLKVASEQDRQTRGFSFIEDAVGNEVQRPLRAGQIIDADHAEQPELVQRGERVSIVVNHGGVRVRAEGRARDGGRRGDVITVESATRRESFQGVVTGVKEVEIGVGPTILTRPREEKRQRL